MVGHGTGHTAECIYSRQWDEDAEAAMSKATNQIRKFLDQPDQQSHKEDDQITVDDFKQSIIHCERSEDCGENQSSVCQDTEGKQYVLKYHRISKVKLQFESASSCLRRFFIVENVSKVKRSYILSK